MSTPPSPPGMNPFPGLRPFREDEEYLFFGREDQVDAMVDKLADTRFLAVVGTSGSGKSSLVNCGLRPALRQGLMSRAGTAWRMAQFRPGGDPIGGMARALSEDGVLWRDFAAAGLSLTEIVETTLRMSKRGLIDIFEQAAPGEGVNLLVVVDQFEELFRYRQLETARGGEPARGVSEEAAAFVNLLLEVTAQTKLPIFIVLTMRSDFLGDCTQFPGLAEAINTGQYLVPRMTRVERRAAIFGPTGVGGAEMSPVLLTRLVNDVGDNPDQLSILQHALNRTWARWQHDGKGEGPLDLASYQAIGAMEHALDQHAEKAYAELGSERQERLAEKLFKALTDKATDSRGVRRPTTLGTLCALADATEAEVTEVIDIFRQPSRSFLMPPAGDALGAETVVDISHESLMRVWRRLDRWADEEAWSARTYLRLADTAARHAAGKASLWRDPDLQLALDWCDQNQPNETWAARYDSGFDAAMRFLTKSREAREAEEAEREAERRREIEAEHAKAEAQRRHARRMRAWALFSGALAVIAILATIWALDSRNDARKSERRSTSGRLASLAINELDHSLDLALLLSVQANRTAPTIEARNSLAAALARSPRLIRFLHHTDRVRDVAFSSDLLASAGYDDSPTADDGPLRGIVRLWDLKTLEPAGALPHPHEVNGVAWNPAGTLLASANDSTSISLWDIATRKLKAKLEQGGWNWHVAFSRDGKLLASAGDGTIGLWEWGEQGFKQKFGRSLRAHDGAVVLNVAFSSTEDRTLLATGSRDRTVILWDVARGTPWKDPLRAHGADEPEGAGSDFGFVEGVDFSPTDGTLLVSAGRDRKIRFWDAGVEPPALLGEPIEPGGRILHVAFSPDGTLLASGSYDTSIRLLDVATRQPVGSPLTGHSAAVRSVAFSLDGKRLASASDDHKVGLWNVENPRERMSIWQPRSLLGHEAGVASVAFSPTDGTLLASAGYDDTVRLWNVATGQPVGAPLATHTDSVVCLAFSPDGTRLATGSNDKTVRIWDVATRLQTGPSLEHGEAVECVAFSADGKRLATASRDRTVRLWKVATGELAGEPLKHEQSVLSVAFSPDGKLLATGLNQDRDTSDAVLLWDLTSRPPRVVQKVHGHTHSGVSLAFSPDGTLLATTGFDKTVRLWSVVRGEEQGEPLVGHDAGVYSVVFSPDGARLATASLDHSVRLWDVATGRSIGPPLLGHEDLVESVTFSRDGKLLASASFDKTIRIWNVDESGWVARACFIANRNLTPKEWEQYVGKDVAYSPTCPDSTAPNEERKRSPASEGAAK